MKREGIAEVVRALAQKPAADLGLDLWDVEYVKEGRDYYLRITIDKEEGVTIDDCEAMHRAIDPILDEADPIEESYHLEVSSPGIERELRTDAHFDACRGWDVEVKLYAPDNGAKTYDGRLRGLTPDGKIAIELPDGNTKEFPRAAVASVKTRFSFDET